VNSSYWFNNTADGESTSLSFVLQFFVEVVREQQRIKLSFCKDESDQNYSQLLLSTPVDTCKISQGVQSNFIMKIYQENFMKTSNSPFVCPFKKNSVLKLTDCLITDKFIPPIFGKKRFKYESNFYGIIKGKKGWTFLHSIVLYGRYGK
jgi:Protein of unknown function (DUF1091)